MKDTVKALLAEHGITLCAPLALSSCRILRPYLLQRAGIENGTAFLLAVPYYTTKCDDPARNISAYAVSRDYHLFFADLFEKVLPLLRNAFPANRFAGFADHSPIAEVEAAAMAGLGCIGQNGLLLTERYASYVFLGEIVTDAVLELPPHTVTHCMACGACQRACPARQTGKECLSALTQRKGTFADDEITYLCQNGSAWGCDRCQEVCPMTKKAKADGSIYTDIAFFKEDAVASLTADAVRESADEAFALRAYSWRGRPTVLRNLEILEKGEHR